MYDVSSRKRGCESKNKKTLNLPKWKPNELIRALLQITMDTDETTDRVNAPTVPS
jgi:hypothetical protein